MKKSLVDFGLIYAIRGFKQVVKSETNFRVQLIIALLVAILGYLLKISYIEAAAIALTVGFVLFAEMVNTAIELLVDYISLDRNETAGKIKDIAAGAVLVSAAVSVVVAVLIFVPKILFLIQ